MDPRRNAFTAPTLARLRLTEQGQQHASAGERWPTLTVSVEGVAVRGDLIGLPEGPGSTWRRAAPGRSYQILGMVRAIGPGAQRLVALGGAALADNANLAGSAAGQMVFWGGSSWSAAPSEGLPAGASQAPAGIIESVGPGNIRSIRMLPATPQRRATAWVLGSATVGQAVDQAGAPATPTNPPFGVVVAIWGTHRLVVTDGLCPEILIDPGTGGDHRAWLSDATPGLILAEEPDDAPTPWRVGWLVTSTPSLGGDRMLCVAIAREILPGSITDIELADDSVTNDKIADGAVTDDKISDVDWSKLLNIPGSFPPSSHTHAASGDVTGNVSGTLTIASNAVTTGKIADQAVTAAKIKDGDVIKKTSGQWTPDASMGLYGGLDLVFATGTPAAPDAAADGSFIGWYYSATRAVLMGWDAGKWMLADGAGSPDGTTPLTYSPSATDGDREMNLDVALLLQGVAPLLGQIIGADADEKPEWRHPHLATAHLGAASIEADGTIAVPDAARYALVFLIGGGGGGGRGEADPVGYIAGGSGDSPTVALYRSGCGGNAGEMIMACFPVAGGNLTCTVGAGGTGGASAGNNGGVGGNTSVTYDSISRGQASGGAGGPANGQRGTESLGGAVSTLFANTWPKFRWAGEGGHSGTVATASEARSAAGGRSPLIRPGAGGAGTHGSAATAGTAGAVVALWLA